MVLVAGLVWRMGGAVRWPYVEDDYQAAVNKAAALPPDERIPDRLKIR